MPLQNKPVKNESLQNEKIILQNCSPEKIELNPISKKHHLKMEPPSLLNNQADIDRLREALLKDMDTVHIPLNEMQKFSEECWNNNWEVTAFTGKMQSGWKVIDVQESNKKAAHFGLAIDIGTTTVVTYLVDMEDGNIEDLESEYNRQGEFGEDILTRIQLAGDKTPRKEMKNAVNETLNSMIAKLCSRNNIKSTDIHGAVISGNSTMVHLFLDLDPSNICMAPYIPVVNNPGLLDAGDTGLDVHRHSPLYCLPGVSSYVGGDAIAGVLVSGMHKKEGISLFVDIGTNGEMVLGNKDWLVACAGAAGPALEGGVAHSGIQAKPGAIESVTISMDGTVHYEVIGNEKPAGICGSGLVDCLAQLFLTGYVDRAGKLKEGESFVIAPAEESATGDDIVITQKDIDSLMRTKGAVSAALDYLMENVGCSLEDLENFYAAGAFGHFLNLESAITIGLYPDLPRENMIRLGNSAGEGARQVLLSEEKLHEIEEICRNITYFELNASEVFMNKFVSSKFLPHTNLNYFPTVKEKLLARGIVTPETT